MIQKLNNIQCIYYATLVLIIISTIALIEHFLILDFGNIAFGLISESQLSNQSKTPINHIIVLSQGKRSFDNYFGTFPGANGYPANLTVPLNPFTKSISQFTAGAWFNTNHSFTKTGFILNKGGIGVDTPGKNMNYGIWMNKSGNVHAGFETKKGVDFSVASNNTHNDGKWHNVYVTYDGNSILSLYLDGQLAAQNKTNGAIPDTSGIQPVRIGSNSLILNNYYTGLVDEVRIWNRSLDSSEISNGYKNNTYDANGQLVYLSFEGDPDRYNNSEAYVNSYKLDGIYLNGSSYRDIEYDSKQFTSFFKPFALKETQTKAPEDGSDVYEVSYNKGAMNGFLYAQYVRGQDPNLVMGYYDKTQIPFYWNLASEFVLADSFFAPSMNTGLAVHQYLYTSSSIDYQKNATFSGRIDLNTTIFDKLQNQGYPWKVYVEDYDSTLNYTNDDTRKNRYLNLLSAIPRFVDNKTLNSNIVDLVEYFRDLREDDFPAVSYIVVPESDESSPKDISDGQVFSANLVLALMKSKHWNDTAFVLTYREPGGWYDHVKPPVINGETYGFRVPTLIVSPFAKQGYVDSTVYDVTSILKFIEYNFGISPLSKRDANATNLLNAFNFTQPPRKAPYNISALSVGGQETDIKIPRSVNVDPINYLYLMIIPLILVIGFILWRYADFHPIPHKVK
jgi:phospholipase C